MIYNSPAFGIVKKVFSIYCLFFFVVAFAAAETEKLILQHLTENIPQDTYNIKYAQLLSNTYDLLVVVL